MSFKQLLAKPIKNILKSSYWLSLLKGKRFILVYHDISTPELPHHAPHLYATLPEVFENQILHLKQFCHFVSTKQILEEDLPQDKINICLHFDDGFQSVADKALPFLKKHQIPFSIFLNQRAIAKNQLWVSNVWINRNNHPFLQLVFEKLSPQKSWQTFKDSPLEYLMNHSLAGFEPSDFDLDAFTEEKKRTYMDEATLLRVVENGATWGNHSANHWVLSQCNDAQLNEEVAENQHFLKKTTGSTTPYFAIPFGKKTHYDQRLEAVCRESRITHWFSTNPVAVSKAIPVPRIGILNESPEALNFYLIRTLFKQYDL